MRTMNLVRNEPTTMMTARDTASSARVAANDAPPVAPVVVEFVLEI